MATRPERRAMETTPPPGRVNAMGAAHDRVIDALKSKGSRTTGGGMWRCPGHDDGKASLHVTNGAGRVLLRCHAGCSIEQVTTALGITKADLFDEQQTTNTRPAIVATYDYHDEDGKVLYQVVRMAPKDFRQRRPDNTSRDGWSWRLGDTRRVPYRLPQVIDAVRAGRTVWVVEGEKDVHALEKAGEVATCNPGGALKWRPEYNQHFRGATIVIVRDKDEPGHRHAEMVSAAVTGTAKSVTIVEAATGKDAADHLSEGLTTKQFIAVSEPGANDDTWAPITDVLAAAAHVPPPPTILTTQDGSGALFYEGRRHVLYGETETLKSWIAAAAAAEVMAHGRDVVWWDSDGMGISALVERLRALGAADNHIARHLLYITPDRAIDDRARDTLTRALNGRDVACAVIDAFNPSLEIEGANPNKTEEVQRFWRVAVGWFHARGIATILIDHVAKNPDSKGDPIASERKLSAADVGLRVELTTTPLTRDHRTATVTITGRKDRPGWHKRGEGRRIGAITFDLDNATPCVLTLGRPSQETASDGGFRPTRLMERVSRHLELECPDGATKQMIERDVKGKAEHIRRAIEVLITERHAHVIEGRVRHLGRYREDMENATDAQGTTPGTTRDDNHPAADTDTVSRPESSHSRPDKTPANIGVVPSRPESSQRHQVNGGVVPPGGPVRSTAPGDDDQTPRWTDENWRTLLPDNHPEAA